MVPSTFPTHISAYLKARGIPESLAHQAGLRPLDAASIRRSVFGPDDDTAHGIPGDGLEIPYRGLDGTAMPGLDGCDFKRYRIFDTRSEAVLKAAGKKPARYLGALSAGHRAYLPPLIPQLMEKGPSMLVVTEGEIKALSGCAHGIVTVGIGGVTMWHDPEKSQDGDARTIETAVHPEIVDLATRIGRVIVLADSDARTKLDVKASMQALAAALAHQAPGALVTYSRVPDADVRGQKWGLDDWLVAKNAKDVTSRLHWVLREAEKAAEGLESGGYEAMGYDDRACYAWSKAKGAIEPIAKRDIFNPAILTQATMLRWAQSAYPKTTETGAATVDWQQLGGDLLQACVDRGPFDPDGVRGPGVWQSETDPNVLVVNSSQCWSTDGEPVDRVSGGHVYPRYKDLGITPDTVPATAEQTAEILACLDTWRWLRKSDAQMMLGWLGLGYVAGALPWRSHMSLTGERGAGKSELMGLARSLHGAVAIYSEGESTEPGIRQAVRFSAPSLLLDEGEADGAHLSKILGFLRVASSGGTVLKGTSDQAGNRFTLRALGMVSGITPPAMNAADASRFVRLTVREMPADAPRTKHAILRLLPPARAALGRALFARVLASWPRYLAAVQLAARHLKAPSARYIDTLSPVIAMSWVMLHDAEMTDADAAQLVASIDISDDLARMTTAAESGDMWSLLMTRAVQTSASGAPQRTTIGELLEHSARERGKGAWSRELGIYGIKVVPQGGSWFEVRANPKAEELKALVKATPFANADLTEALRRHPNAERKSDRTDRIGGGTPVRFVAIRLEINPPTTPSPLNPIDLV